MHFSNVQNHKRHMRSRCRMEEDEQGELVLRGPKVSYRRGPWRPERTIFDRLRSAGVPIDDDTESDLYRSYFMVCY